MTPSRVAVVCSVLLPIAFACAHRPPAPADTTGGPAQPAASAAVTTAPRPAPISPQIAWLIGRPAHYTGVTYASRPAPSAAASQPASTQAALPATVLWSPKGAKATGAYDADLIRCYFAVGRACWWLDLPVINEELGENASAVNVRHQGSVPVRFYMEREGDCSTRVTFLAGLSNTPANQALARRLKDEFESTLVVAGRPIPEEKPIEEEPVRPEPSP